MLCVTYIHCALQEPLMDAMADDAANASVTGGNAAGGARGAANPFAQLFGGASAPAASAPAASAAPPASGGSPPVPNTSPLPNPWAPSSAQPAGAAGVHSRITDAPWPYALPALTHACQNQDDLAANGLFCDVHGVGKGCGWLA